MGKLIFVTRATRTSGKGHFFRVIRMLDSLENICDCWVVVDEEAIVGYEHLKCHPYNEMCPEVLIQELDLNSDDIIWFDIPDSQYSIISRFQGKNIKLISTNMFDKLGEERFEDVAVYPVYETYKRAIVNKTTIQFSGSEFICLPEEFFYEGDEKKHFVLVTMGGSDPMKFTPLVLQAITNIKKSHFVYKVILPKEAIIEDLLTSYSKCTHLELYKFGQLDFARTLRSAKYAIINGGMTRYECIAAKVYFIALSIHQTQYSLTENVSKYGFGLNFGIFNDNCIASLSSQLENLPVNPSFDNHSDGIPLLRVNGAKWIYNQIIQALTYENE